MSIYERGAASVRRALTRNGQAATITRTTATGGGPSSLTGGTRATAEHSCRVALFPIDQRDVDGALVKAGDWRAIVTAIDGFAPTTTDKLICTEGELSIIDPGKFAPAGTVTHYDMLVRKA